MNDHLFGPDPVMSDWYDMTFLIEVYASNAPDPKFIFSVFTFDRSGGISTEYHSENLHDTASGALHAGQEFVDSLTSCCEHEDYGPDMDGEPTVFGCGRRPLVVVHVPDPNFGIFQYALCLQHARELRAAVASELA